MLQSFSESVQQKPSHMSAALPGLMEEFWPSPLSLRERERESLGEAAACIHELPESSTKFPGEQTHLRYRGAPSLLVVLAVRKCCFLRESRVESLSNAKLGLTLMPAGRVGGSSQLTEKPWKSGGTNLQGCTCC